MDFETGLNIYWKQVNREGKSSAGLGALAATKSREVFRLSSSPSDDDCSRTLQSNSITEPLSAWIVGFEVYRSEQLRNNN